MKLEQCLLSTIAVVFIFCSSEASGHRDTSLGHSADYEGALHGNGKLSRQERLRRRMEREQQRRQQREENRRRRQERRRNKQRHNESEAVEGVLNMEWLASNLTSLWEAVRELQALQDPAYPDIDLKIGIPRETAATDSPIENSPLCNSSQLHCDTNPLHCQMVPGAQVCSGAGECCCGQCLCRNGRQGRFCECNTDCPRFSGEVCNGRGTCECGECKCSEGFSGDSCECPLDTSLCRPPNSPPGDGVCSNHGYCQCGECICTDVYRGRFCEQSPYSAGVCEQLKNCVLCSALGKTMPQCSQCTEVTVRRVPSLDDSHRRCRMVHTGCLLVYSYTTQEDGTYDVTVPQDLVC